ncbi:ferredoxin-type protein NapG [Salmonella enterica subsp. enterica serovar Enteritidis]|nr:ferredoxin-type protein NapG [Salmonella enterica subsp. enterica serovar Enteritidis]
MSRTAKPQNGRRRFLRDVVRTAGGLAAVGVALGLQQQTARASGVRLRPPGALNKDIASIDDSRMGLAVLLDQENCLNFQGLRCDVCYRECPKIDEAITLELDRNMRTGKHARFLPTVHSDACTGCGKCEKVCVLEQPAIKVLPLSLAKGELGHHYRFGWLEGKDGKS